MLHKPIGQPNSFPPNSHPISLGITSRSTSCHTSNCLSSSTNPSLTTYGSNPTVDYSTTRCSSSITSCLIVSAYSSPTTYGACSTSSKPTKVLSKSTVRDPTIYYSDLATHTSTHGPDDSTHSPSIGNFITRHGPTSGPVCSTCTIQNYPGHRQLQNDSSKAEPVNDVDSQQSFAVT